MKKKQNSNIDVSYEKKRLIQSFLWFLFIVIGVTAFQYVRGTGHSVTTEIDIEQIGIVVDSNDAIFIPFDEIKSIMLYEDYDYGTRVEREADTEENYFYGEYENTELGKYQLMAFADTSKCIAITTSQETYLYNLSTNKKTEKEYQEIETIWKGEN